MVRKQWRYDGYYVVSSYYANDDLATRDAVVHNDIQRIFYPTRSMFQSKEYRETFSQRILIFNPGNFSSILFTNKAKILRDP